MMFNISTICTQSINASFLLLARYFKKLNLKNQRSTARDDTACSSVAICQLLGNGKLSLLTNAHTCNTLIPSFDYLACAQSEGEGLVPVVRGVKFLAIKESPQIMDLQVIESRSGCCQTQ